MTATEWLELIEKSNPTDPTIRIMLKLFDKVYDCHNCLSYGDDESFKEILEAVEKEGGGEGSPHSTTLRR